MSNNAAEAQPPLGGDQTTEAIHRLTSAMGRENTPDQLAAHNPSSPPDEDLETQLIKDGTFAAQNTVQQQNAKQPLLNIEGERLLLDVRILGARGVVARRLLGCLACLSHRNKDVYKTRLGDCHDIDPSGNVGILKKLVEAGILESTPEKRNKRGRPKVFYTFADNDLAKALKQRLELPKRCGIDGKQLGEGEQHGS